MPKLEYFLVAESLSIDVNTDAVSLFNILTNVRMEIPGTIPRLVAASCWLSSDEEIRERCESQIKLHFWMPEATEPRIFRSNLTSESRSQYLHLKIVNVPLEKEGEIRVEVLLDDQTVATHTISISSET